MLTTHWLANSGRGRSENVFCPTYAAEFSRLHAIGLGGVGLVFTHMRRGP